MRPGNPKIAGALYRPTASRRAAPQQQRTILVVNGIIKVRKATGIPEITSMATDLHVNTDLTVLS